ncbi:MAG: hypothetical protein LIO44_06235 [Eubacterium sp.]|nr:hypothetical protein [Eubacterium sp.]
MNYLLKIVRKKSLFGCAMSFKIKVDGQPNVYMLKNGGAVEIMLTEGMHNLVISMTGAIKSTKVNLSMMNNRILTCEINPTGTFTNGILSGPAIVKDENGNKLS